MAAKASSNRRSEESRAWPAPTDQSIKPTSDCFSEMQLHAGTDLTWNFVNSRYCAPKVIGLLACLGKSCPTQRVSRGPEKSRAARALANRVGAVCNRD